ncbi:RNA 2',3'-cyclic phosphodiesterase [Acidomonas methanolica]|uniref:RNA 2',3'-cyclic phosphodiesterase n=1 Tax=Acidomonas methanolica TaxID=437 RepID=UPI00211A19A7|nr:RNA 2',3'-cyclic phosphodiesterase [Acidomonas methanolica]
MRLFTALEIASEQKLFLAERRVNLPGAIWTPPENYHLTLRFLGEIKSRHMAEEVDFALSRIEATTFTLQISGIGVTATPRGERLWFGVEPSERLVRLQSRIETALRRIGLSPDTRRFTPRVTVAYLPWSPAAARWVQLNNLSRPEPMLVHSFTLFRSFLGTDAPHYENCADYPLAHPLVTSV